MSLFSAEARCLESSSHFLTKFRQHTLNDSEYMTKPFSTLCCAPTHHYDVYMIMFTAFYMYAYNSVSS